MMASADGGPGPRLATRAAEVLARRRNGPPQSDTAHDETGRSWPVRAAALARRHWLISALLVGGLVLRVLALVAYRPALIYVDTLKYLYGASSGSDPVGYTGLLKVVLLGGDLGTVALLQHLAGLAMGVTLYVAVLRRGAARWLAALAAAPVLLDGYQLQIEQTIMPDVWFEVLIVAGLAVLLWRPAASLRAAVAAGFVLGTSATVRQVGEILVLPAVIFALAAGGGWRAIARSAALAAAFAVPILAYSTVAYANLGQFRVGRGQATIGRTVAAADCATLKLPADVRRLCPTPAQQARGPDYLEHDGKSPLYSTPVPAGTRTRLLGALNGAIRQQQPQRVVVAILRDSVRLFALTRSEVSSVTPISRWQFQTTYPTYPNWVTLSHGNVIVVGVQPLPFGPFVFHALDPSYGGRAQVDRPVAAFLRSYQLDGGYTPGPLLALSALAGLAGWLLLLRRPPEDAGYRQPALACLLLILTATSILLTSDVFEFSWRYQLPALVTLPPAGALGIAALLAFIRSRRSSGVIVTDPPQKTAENRS